MKITSERRGTPTYVTAECDTAEQAQAAHAAFAQISRVNPFQVGLTVSGYFNKREAARLVATLDQIARAAVPAPAQQTAAAGRTWRHRELVSVSYGNAPATILRDGETLRLDGFGREFVAGEMAGPAWGDLVRYAYYV